MNPPELPGAPSVTDAAEAAEVQLSTPSSPGAASPRRPSFTITDAAVACAVSRKTITRKLPELALHGAAKDDDGVWQIPVEALLAVGLHPGRSMPEEHRPARTVDLRREQPAAPAPASDPAREMVTIPRERWDDVRIRLAKAEAEASERALALADARLALRALTAGPSVADGEPEALGPHSGGARMVPPTPARIPPTADVPAAAVGGTHGAAVALRAESAMAGDVGGMPTSRQRRATAPEVDGEADLFRARSHAARNGGYLPGSGGAVEPRKRRWWQPR